MKDLIVNNLVPITSFACMVIYLIYVYKKQGKEKAISTARLMIVSAMLSVEKSLKGTVSGQDKFKLVADYVWKNLPITAKFILGSEERLLEEMDKLYGKALDLIDDGIVNNSVTRDKIE